MAQYWNSSASMAGSPVRPVEGLLRWNKSFTIRQPDLYKNEGNRVQANSNEHALELFLGRSQIQLGPPQRFQALREFLEKDQKPQQPHAAKESYIENDLILVDDRCDPSPLAIPGNESAQFSRPWDVPKYMENPPRGSHVQTYALNAEDLHRHLKKDRKGIAERRILYIKTLTPAAALSIIRNIPYIHLTEIRSFMNRHIGLNPYMNVYQSPGFVLEFHLPHFVLRKDSFHTRDDRGLRKFRHFHPQGKLKGSRKCIYEAQMSCIVFGMDEFFWTAYFFADGYYNAQESIDGYLRDKLDASSGGYLHQDSPIWDPRYYFLTVFSVRLNQVTLEWGVLVQEIEKTLDSQSEITDQSLPGFIEKDPTLERTKQHTWTLCLLRRLRNSLAKLITAWRSFESDQGPFFDLDTPGNLPDKFRERFSHMRGKVAELRALHMTLEQRIETLEKMSDELVRASSLSESIAATRQGSNIQILTYITIIYLPVTLITGCFGMNQVPETVPWWNYWVLLGGLTALTIAVALVMPRIRSLWASKKASKPQERLPY